MPDAHPQLVRYLQHTLGVEPVLTPWERARELPLFLRDRYRLLTAKVMGVRCLFTADTQDHEESPAAIRKHIDQLRGKWDDPVVYVRERITAYNRKRLVEQGVPFIVPGTQMYLPIVGIDFREHFRKLRQAKGSMGPAAQAVLIHALSRTDDDLSPTPLARKLGYTVMTMSRALDELVALGLGESTATGRARRFRLVEPKPRLWAKAQASLRSPVTKRHMIRGVRVKAPRSGLDALSHYSELAESADAVVALSRDDWAALRAGGRAQPAMTGDPGAVTAEVWAYAPTLFARGGVVDPLSLFLSMRDIEDERVQMALDQMVDAFAW